VRKPGREAEAAAGVRAVAYGLPAGGCPDSVAMTAIEVFFPSRTLLDLCSSQL
jgi:hypothetical protein